MIHVLLIVLIVLAVLAAAVVALRVRKLRRDEMRTLSRPVERRLISPPPSPYQPSQGFRLLDDAGSEAVRPTPQRPRLEPSRDYIFNELSGPGAEERPVLPNRHDADWALARSQHRAASPGGGARLLVGVVVLIAAVSVAGYALRHRPAKGHTTTTLTSSASTTTTIWPARFIAVSTDATAKTATYDVPTARYSVTVTGASGAVWTVYRMGSANTLEFQGTVARGAAESLVLTGVSRVTLGSPHNASVTVGGSPVSLPSPLQAPLTLVFTPTPG